MSDEVLGAGNEPAPQVPGVIGKIEIIILSNGDVQARTTLPSLETFKAVGIAQMKLAAAFQAKQTKPAIVMPDGRPIPNMRG